MGNGNNGVWIADGAQSNRIGVHAGDPDASAEPNEIAANSYSGIRIGDPQTDQNLVAGNFIGTDANCTAQLGNGSDGVSIAAGAQANVIGGASGLGNAIRFNGANGVGVYDAASTGDVIRFNAISSNTALGIDLGGDGVTPNHGSAIASGPNDLMNYPVITSAGSGTTTVVGISFVAPPAGSYTIDFYSNRGADPSGHGEGNPTSARSRWRPMRPGSSSRRRSSTSPS